ADQEVTCDAPDVARRECQHKQPEEVEAVAHAGHRSAQREHERAGEVQHRHERVDADDRQLIHRIFRFYFSALSILTSASSRWMRVMRSRTPRRSASWISPRSSVSWSRISGRMSDWPMCRSAFSGGSSLRPTRRLPEPGGLHDADSASCSRYAA